MAERKVFNKYIPPDFDPRLVPKSERPLNNQIHVRSMLPMTISCTQCGEYMGRGTKFNARQEEAIGMAWMGLKRWRFYLKCSSCCQEMTFLTDPENDHYVTEHGCTCNLEPWRVKEEVNKILSEQQKEIESDSIKALENKSSIIKNQLDLMDTINDLQDMNQKNACVNHDHVIEQLHKKRKCKEMNEESEQIAQFKLAKKQKLMQEKTLPFHAEVDKQKQQQRPSTLAAQNTSTLAAHPLLSTTFNFKPLIVAQDGKIAAVNPNEHPDPPPDSSIHNGQNKDKCEQNSKKKDMKKKKKKRKPKVLVQL